MPKKIDKTQIELRMQEKHHYKYIYDLTSYQNTRSLITITCPLHGSFKQRISDHLYSGCGCPSCDTTKKFTTEDFISKSKSKHCDTYDYLLSEYGNNNYDKVTITCRIHGNFEQTPFAHMRGQGCPECANNRLYTNEEFITMCREKHNGIYDYSIVEYKGKNNYIKVICNKHGEFEQLAKLHLAGYGCKKCKMSKLEIWMKSFLDEKKIRWEFNKKFDLKYKKLLSFDFWLPDYNICIECDGIQHHKAVEFFGGEERLEEQIIKDSIKDEWCKQNGIYLIRITDFVNPFELIDSTIIDNFSNKIIEEKKNLIKFNKIKKTRFDINELNKFELLDFLKSNVDIEEDFELEGEKFIRIIGTNLLIKYVDFFNYSEINSAKRRLMVVYDIAKRNDFKVVQFFEDDWKYRNSIVRSRILNLLGKSQKIGARKTKIKLVTDSKLVTQFLNSTHIQGFVPSKYKIGIFYKEEMVGLLTLSDLRINLGQKKEAGTFEILRYSCKNGLTIIGGFDKALKYFIQNYNPTKIVSYANRMWSNENNVYSKIGMKLESVSDASYFYLVDDRREGRFSYRKDVLLQKWGFPPTMTEHTIMLANSVYRIFDAGCFKYSMLVNEKTEC